MEDLFKKVMYTGVGVVSTAAENVQQSINELVEKRKLSETEGKKVVEDVLIDTKNKRDEFETKLKDLINKTLGRLDFPTRTEVEKLNARIAQLETEASKK